jgi:Circularly permutated YpsA SLOG family
VKIISGGQTGVDRAALDVALKYGIPCGGCCPAGRLDEFGKIPERYPLEEHEHASFSERTRQNVIDSDGTVMIYDRQLSGGTKETVRFCRQLDRPYQLVDASRVRPEQGADLVRDLVAKHNIDTLNVAGPRQSEWPEGYNYATQTLERFFSSKD